LENVAFIEAKLKGHQEISPNLTLKFAKLKFNPGDKMDLEYF
jgi:hypothetical protein